MSQATAPTKNKVESKICFWTGGILLASCALRFGTQGPYLSTMICIFGFVMVFMGCYFREAANRVSLPRPTPVGTPVKKKAVSAEKRPNDDGVRWLKFKHDATIKAGMVVPAGTIILGRPEHKLALRSIFRDIAGIGWCVEFDDGYATIVPKDVVEEIKPLGLPVKKIPRPEETPDRFRTACWLTLKTAIEFSPGSGFEAGKRGLGFPVPEGWVIDLAADRPLLLIPDSAVEVEGPFLKLDELRWLKCKVDVPRHGKLIPAGRLIVGSRIDNGWKVGAEYSDFIEDTWRSREETGDDNINIVKVDVTPSMIIPDSMVEAGTRARWFNGGQAGKTPPPEIRVKCAKCSDEPPMSRATKLVYTGWRLKPKVDIVAENGKCFRKGESITGMPVSEGWEVRADSKWKLWAIIPGDLVEATNSVTTTEGERALEKMQAELFGEVLIPGRDKAFARFRAHASTWDRRN